MRFPPEPSPPWETPLARASDAAAREGGRRFPGPLTGMAVSMATHLFVLLVLALIITGAYDDPRSGPVLISNLAAGPEPEFEAFEILELEVVDPPPRDQLPQDMADVADIVAVTNEALADVAALNDEISLVQGGLEATDLMAEVPAGKGRGGPGRGGGEGFGGEIGRRIARAGGQSGAIQISLAWNNGNDIDLHVLAPSGERLFYGHPRSICGGHLDIDTNAIGPVTREAVENIYWPVRSAPVGSFQVYVHYFAQHEVVDVTPYEIHILIDGVKQKHEGTLRRGDPPVLVAEFVRRMRMPQAPDFRE